GYLLGCVQPLDGGASTCQKLGATVDAGCDAQQHTAAACARSLGFACVRRHCTQDPFANAGQSCGLDLDAGRVTRCTFGATCTGDAGAQSCVAPAAEGFGCDTGLG